MTREEACLIGFSIIQTSGMAKNKLFAALDAVSAGDYSKAQNLINRASDLICRSRSIQEAFKESAKGAREADVVMNHGENYLKTTQVLRDYVLDLTKVDRQKLYLPSIYHRYS